MERENIIINNKAIPIIYFLFVIDIVGNSIKDIRSIISAITPYILFSICILALFEPLIGNKKLLIWCVLTFFITLSLEALGTNTGLFFGNFHYGEALGARIMNTPFIIGLNWVTVILGSSSIAILFSKNKIALVLISSCLVLFFDYILEPVAVNLNYWYWFGGKIPFYNYESWMIIALLASVSLSVFVKNFYHINFIHFYLGQLISLVFLNILFRF